MNKCKVHGEHEQDRCQTVGFTLPDLVESYRAKNKQVGGDHYKKLAIQPTDYIAKNNLNWYAGNAVKYITRAPHKGTFEQDLQKAIHYIELWIEAGDASV